MPVVQRGQSYQATVNFKGERYRRQFPTEIEARAWEAQAKLALSKGQAVDLGTAAEGDNFRPATMSQLATYLLTHKWAGTKAEKSARINLTHMVKLIGPETPIKTISTHVINLAVAQLKDAGYPEVTINKKLSPLRVCLKYASDQDWIDKVPTIPFYKAGEGRIRWFTDDEEEAMLKWARAHLQDTLLDYIVVSMDTGLRQGEVLTLKARNLGDNRVTVYGMRTATDNGTKAGNTRTIPLTPRAKEVLERLAENNTGLLFPFTKDQITGMWNRMRDGLGFKQDPEYVPHAMRHTFCTRLVRAKVNLAVIQKLAGHLRIETTLKYVHVDDDVLVEAIASLAPRVEVVYTPTPSGTAVAEAQGVAHHINHVVPSKQLVGTDNTLVSLRKSA